MREVLLYGCLSYLGSRTRVLSRVIVLTYRGSSLIRNSPPPPRTTIRPLAAECGEAAYRSTSLIRKHRPIGLYSRLVPMVLRRS